MNPYVFARAYRALIQAGVAHRIPSVTMAQHPTREAWFATAGLADCGGPA
jgi:hypothetical protein